jgi:putative tricarboxylic transport membrane protein
MLILGLRPGPTLFEEQPEFLYGIFGAMLGANIFFMFLGMVGAKVFGRISLIPRTFLWPMVFVMAALGAYAVRQSLFDVLLMLIFSFLGFIMKRHGYVPAPIVMGLILGELVEDSLKQSYLLFDGNLFLFFTRPVTVLFFILSIAGVTTPFIKRWIMNRK